MTTTATTVKRQLLAARISQTRSLNNEAALKWELHKFFLNLKDKVLKELHEYYPDDTGILLEGHLDLILAPIFESQQKYYNILRRFNHKEYNFGVREAKRLVKLAHNNNSGASKSQNNVKLESLFDAGFEKDDLFATQKWSEETLLNHSFTASETTMNRVDKDINNILTDGYKSGKGIPHVRDQINKRFNQLADWEAQRIARTEIHNAHQMGIINTYNELGIQYVQWSSTHDTRTRGNKPSDKANHVKLDGEIIPLGGTFSNGLEFPGDTKGPLREWINCRCSLIPFIIPDGYMAPSFSPFKESDLVPTLDLYNYDDIVAQATSEVKQNTSHMEEFLKQEQTVIRAKTKIKDHDKYLLNEEQLSRYNELKGKNLKFLEKHEFKQLESQIRFNELHNQLLIDGKLERELEKEYNHLSSLLEDVLAKPVESKSTGGVFNDSNFFKLSESEKARRAELMQKTKDKTILPEEKAERRLLGERERIQDLHEKLLKEGLNESETGKYLDEYVRLKQHGMDLPEIPTNLKFTTPKPSFEKYNFSEVKIGNKYSLTKKESDELYELEKKQLLSEKAVIKDSLTEKELSRIKELQSQKEFNQLYYIRKGEGGLNYASEMKYEKLVSQFKSKLKLSDDLVKKSPLPKYSNKVKSSNDKPLKLKGKNEDGLPPDHKIKDLFTIDVTEATANEQRVVTRWMGNDFTYFRDYTVRCKGNLDDYIEYVLNASEDQLKHYGYIKTLVQNGETENVIKEITQIAKSLDHDLPVLDNILNNNMTKKNMIFWRVEERHHLGDDPKPGDIVTFKGRNSTAITKEGAEHFAEVTNRTMEWTYEIEAPAGTRGAYVSHLNQSEKIRQEMEYLLAEDTQMEIITFNDKKKYAKLRIIVDEGATKSMFSYIINNIKKVLINV